MFIKGEYRLRMLELSDLTFVKDLRLDESTSVNLGTFIFINDTMQKKWFDSLCVREDYKVFIFEKIENEVCTRLGYVRLSDIDRVNLSICVGGDISHDFRGQGLGKILYSLILSLCFHEWNMNRVWLLVVEYNTIARSLYNSLGFIEEGKQRSAIFKNGSFHDYIMLSIIKGEWNER